MKYIKSYVKYRLNEGWLGNKINEWDNDTKVVMVDFIKPFKDIVKSLPDWKTTNSPEKVKIGILNSFETSFNSLNNNIGKLKKKETLLRMYDDIIQMIVLLNDVISKDLNNNEDESNSSLKLVIDGILDVIKDRLKSSKMIYIDKVKKADGIDTKRSESTLFFREIFNKIKTDIKEVNVDVLSVKGEEASKNSSRINKSDDNMELKADEKVKYVKKNGEENIATVCNNQENLPDDIVRLRSEDNNDTFTINKSQIIEVLTDQDPDDMKGSISKKLGGIDNDIKLRKVKDFIDDLSDEN